MCGGMPQGGCLVSSNWNAALGILKRRVINLEVQSAADRLNGVAVEIDSEKQGARRAREQEVPGNGEQSLVFTPCSSDFL